MTLYTVGSRAALASLDVDQYYYLLTGSMPDQAITLVNGVNIVAPLTVLPLASPGIKSASVIGNPTTNHTYQIVGRNANGDSMRGAPYNVLCPNPINVNNTVTLSWSMVPGGGLGSTSFLVLRDSNALIGTVNVVAGTLNYTFLDTGQTGSAYNPAGTIGIGTGIRFMGAISGGVPSGYSASIGDVVVDKTGGRIWVCRANGNPGKWGCVGPGTWRTHAYLSANAAMATVGWNIVPINVSDDPINTDWDTANYWYVCPQTGWYRVTGTCSMTVQNNPSNLLFSLFDVTANPNVEKLRGSQWMVRGGTTGDSWGGVMGGRVLMTKGTFYQMQSFNSGPANGLITGTVSFLTAISFEFSGLAD